MMKKMMIAAVMGLVSLTALPRYRYTACPEDG